MRPFFVSSEASVTVASWISLNYRIRISECMLDKLAWMVFSHANKNISGRMPWMSCTKYYTKLEKKSRRTSNYLTIKQHHIIVMSYSLIFFSFIVHINTIRYYVFFYNITFTPLSFLSVHINCIRWGNLYIR